MEKKGHRCILFCSPPKVRVIEKYIQKVKWVDFNKALPKTLEQVYDKISDMNCLDTMVDILESSVSKLRKVNSRSTKIQVN